MNSAPHLLVEDRPEFERVLDEALRTVARASPATNAQLAAAQLRAMALSASAAISACAATEYEHYRAVREQQRAARDGERAEAVRRGRQYASAGGGVGDTSSGAGLFAMMGVLTPILAGTAALIFLLIGYALSALTPPPPAAGPLRTAGWVFAAIALAGILLAMVGLVRTAIRDGSGAIRVSHNAQPTQLELAKTAWLTALRDRGIVPFLQEVLADGTASEHARGDDEPRLPHLGYSHPGFSSPGGEGSDSGRPRFTSPGFTSPDFSSPDAGSES